MFPWYIGLGKGGWLDDGDKASIITMQIVLLFLLLVDVAVASAAHCKLLVDCEASLG